ncbi:hypothetical protein BC938DRAFT_475228 [Jimgerdemannia flammicorona]|uniref:Uncharacterized protein n=1 Tax=Jimgerdemannia flammicorona TaxID=994334 RepID=A0A433PYG0_9FUNG|nr:hypothetical protein BC938DRAFT_475228 [Jimgerdemannia flammicorona]
MREGIEIQPVPGAMLERFSLALLVVNVDGFLYSNVHVQPSSLIPGASTTTYENGVRYIVNIPVRRTTDKQSHNFIKDAVQNSVRFRLPIFVAPLPFALPHPFAAHSSAPSHHLPILVTIISCCLIA